MELLKELKREKIKILVDEKKQSVTDTLLEKYGWT